MRHFGTTVIYYLRIMRYLTLLLLVFLNTGFSQTKLDTITMQNVLACNNETWNVEKPIQLDWVNTDIENVKKLNQLNIQTKSETIKVNGADKIRLITDEFMTEALAKEKDLNYVKLDGEVGIIGNGAGLVMSTLDVVAYAGEKFGGVKPANFLDIGGGASAQVMADGLSIILGDKDVKSVFVNVFGGITSCDAVANGILQALEILGPKAAKPIVVRLDGNNVVEGRRILNEAAHPLIQQLDTMDGAASRAAELASSSSGVAK